MRALKAVVNAVDESEIQMDVSFNINRSEESEDYQHRAAIPKPIFNTAYVAASSHLATFELDPDEEGTAAQVTCQNKISEKQYTYKDRISLNSIYSQTKSTRNAGILGK